MKRRDFLASTLAALPACVAFDALAQAPKVRRDVTKLTSAQVDSLRRGVDRMQAIKDPVNVMSWTYWAQVHDYPEGVTVPPQLTPIWASCEHSFFGTYAPHFLSWHRAYLWAFEQVLRAQSGDPELTLPYWNWYADGSIPSAFASEKIGGVKNALWSERTPGLNEGKVRIVTAPQDAFDPSNLQFLRSAASNGFSLAVERDPHNEVHGQCGGLMLDPATAALDPIFWLHHASVDRLWHVWLSMGGGRQNPPASNPWWNQGDWRFDVQDKYKKGVKGVIDTSAMGYVYDSDQLADKPLAPQSLPKAPAAASTSSPGAPGKAGLLTLGEQKPMSIGPDGVTVRFPLSDAAKKGVGLLSRGQIESGAFTSVELLLEDVELTGAHGKHGFSYGVYINLPAEGGGGDAASRHYVGSFGPFELSRKSHHAGHAESRTLRFQLTGKLAELAKANPSALSNIAVSIVRRGPSGPGGGLLSMPTSKPLITVGKMRVEASVK